MALDIIFISYDEPNAEENWQTLKERFPYAKRVHGIEGIPNAHKAAAKLATTTPFYTVDGDTVVLDSFDFSFKPDKWERDFVHLWYAENPLTGLSYGWGGIKLWPKRFLLDAHAYDLDFTTSVVDTGMLKIHEDVASISMFNASPFEAWKAAFRECVKLSLHDTDENKERLDSWVNATRCVSYSDYAILGARAGEAYGRGNKNDQEALNHINDFEWLREHFNSYDMSNY